MRWLLTITGGLSFTVGSVLYLWVMTDSTHPLATSDVMIALAPVMVGFWGLSASRSPGRFPLELGADASLRQILGNLVILSLVAYVGLIPCFWALGWAHVRSWPSTVEGEAATFAGLMALWMPLWWAPGAGSVFTWLRVRKGLATASSKRPWA